MSIRESISNLIRSDRPESPTDVVFVFGSLIMIDLWIYATLSKATIPHIVEVLGFLVVCKGVKVASNWTKKGDSNGSSTDTATPQ